MFANPVAPIFDNDVLATDSDAALAIQINRIREHCPTRAREPPTHGSTSDPPFCAEPVSPGLETRARRAFRITFNPGRAIRDRGAEPNPTFRPLDASRQLQAALVLPVASKSERTR